jgi:hypothetical protein
MSGEVGEESFFSRLMGTHWFKETVDLDFNGEYRVRYEDTLNALTARGAIMVRDGKLTTTVKP